MYELMCLDVHSQNNHTLDAFKFLVPEPLQCCLSGQDPEELPNTLILAYGAFLNESPIGIVLASFRKDLKDVYLHHLFVLPDHRNKHLGRQLLSALKEDAKTRGAHFFSLIYPDQPKNIALEKVLACTGWKGVRPFITRCLYDVSKFDLPWLHKDYHYPKGFTLFSWKDLTAEEKHTLHLQLSQRVFSGFISPFLNEDNIEPLNSLGLRYQEQIVGWIITHRIKPDTICYSSLFVDRRFQFKGIAMKLLFDSIRLHLSQPTPWAIFELPLLHVHPSWIRFVERRLIPYADNVTHLMQAWDYW